MANHEVLHCPLCHGRFQVSLSELRELATSGAPQQWLERTIAELESRAGQLHPASVTSNTTGRDFQKEVHSWNPQLPIWQRSPKE
jgi:hypothetical protein